AAIRVAVAHHDVEGDRTVEGARGDVEGAIGADRTEGSVDVVAVRIGHLVSGRVGQEEGDRVVRRGAVDRAVRIEEHARDRGRSGRSGGRRRGRGGRRRRGRGRL